jgi:hypothetical protein
MVNKITESLIKQLKKSNLSLEDRTALTTALLDKLGALPLTDTIKISAGEIVINGKPLEMEQAIAFRESLVALSENQARKLIHQQLRYLAIGWAVNSGTNNETLMFSKASLWLLDQENNLINNLDLQ